MEGLAAYGSDSDASSSGSASAQDAGVQPTGQPILPPPRNLNHNYLASHLAVVPTQDSSTGGSSNAASASTSPPLADTLRSQASFRNPRHVSQVAASLQIRDWYGTEILRSSVPTEKAGNADAADMFAPWEANVLELEARARGAMGEEKDKPGS